MQALEPELSAAPPRTSRPPDRVAFRFLLLGGFFIYLRNKIGYLGVFWATPSVRTLTLVMSAPALVTLDGGQVGAREC